MKRTISLFAALILSPLSALAGSAETRVAEAIEGCSPVLTAQSRQCLVTHIYMCENDFVAVLFKENSTYSIVWGDAQGGLQEVAYFSPPSGFRLTEIIAPSSIDDLRGTGKSGFHAIGNLTSGKIALGTIEVSWETKLSGRVVDFNGIGFRTGQSVTTIKLPGDLGDRVTTSKIFLANDYDLVLSGETFSESNEDPNSPKYRLMDVTRPGQPGFLSTTGLYDCRGSN